MCEQQYGSMPRKSTTDAIFALRILMEKYRDGQRELHCVFVDLEKAYDRVPREELWYCMRKSGVAEKYVRVVQDMYERCRTVVRCAVGQTEEFKVEVGLHQGSALSPFLFAMVMDQLSEEVRQESPWTMMFADDIVICSESREQVEESLERWRFALERRGMKISRSKTEYMCVDEREGSGTVRLQSEEVKKVQEFKYLGSTVQSNGECGKEVKKRVQAGSLESIPRDSGQKVGDTLDWVKTHHKSQPHIYTPATMHVFGPGEKLKYPEEVQGEHANRAEVGIKPQPQKSEVRNTTASARISACLADISSWMTALKLNPSEIELLVIPDSFPAQDLALSLNNSMISPSATARNLEPSASTARLVPPSLRWLARLPHTSRVGGSIPASAVCVEFACSPRASGVSSGYSGFLPRSKDMHCRLIGIFKLCE
ncbi:hypothetical protein QTP70_019005 [Hemibagrus guttatus]|uniref:ribonuclease H n=1 Tax=Hemibagrus guttatus TaxID=175788 RepID=A0AAE0UV53_9TELE|nr:hypothetical protein QTP70_019005 [Hemibagrus guttatus]